MRKLKLQMQLSLDSFIAGPNGEMDWMTCNWDDGLKRYVLQLTQPVNTIVLGRKLADGFIPTWEGMGKDPATADEFVHKMNNTLKVVFTRTLEKSDWANTILAKGDLVQEVASLKNTEGGDIIAYGGKEFVSGLIETGLIDEYYLFINPVALGTGMSIFTDLGRRLSLKIAETTAFDCGVVVLKYLPE